MRINRGIITVTALAALSLTGCATEPASDSESNASVEALPTPTEINRPENHRNCTITIERDVNEGEHPDQAKIACGDETREVAGDFSDKTSNWYDRESGVSNIVVVGKSMRAWVYTGHGDDTCGIVYEQDGASARCIPDKTDTATPEPTDGHTVQPEDAEAATA